MRKILFKLFLLFFLASLSACTRSGNQVSELELIPVKSGGDYFYINKEGKIVINPQFSKASVFREGLALVRTSGENSAWGFIDEDGKYVIAPTFKQATVFNENLAWVVAPNGAPSAINNKGEVKFTLQNAESVKLFHEGLAAFNTIDSSGSRWGFVDQSGMVVINAQFANIGSFSEGKCAVENTDGKWGYIDKKGNIIINYQFTKANEFMGENAVVYTGEKAGVIDENGKFVINPQFENLLADGDHYLVKQGGNYGWCDADGSILINPQFALAFPFVGNDMAPVQSGSNWGFVDLEGKFTINPQFTFAFPFNGTMAMVTSGLQAGFIDKEGKYIINPQFNDVSPDFFSFINNIESDFNMVKTDYFNISSITQRINLNNPESIRLGSKLSDMLSLLKISEDIFSNYYSEHTIFAGQKISEDALLKFQVDVVAYSEEPDGWYPKKVFNPDAVIDGFTYTINLVGKGAGKGEQIANAIKSSLTGYDPVGNPSDDNDKTYADGKQEVRIKYYSSEVIIKVRPIEKVSLPDELYTD